MTGDPAMAPYQQVLESCNDAETFKLWTLLTSFVGGRLRNGRTEMVQTVIGSTSSEEG
jgi:hypothetical protein